MTRVKICGLTRERDVEQAVGAGADYIGLVFHPPSARHVTVRRARALADAARAAGLVGGVVGVFVAQSAEEIARTSQAVGLDVAQLYGSDRPLHPATVWRALRVETRWDGDAVTRRGMALGADADAVLLDRHDDRAMGGTGLPFDPDLAVDLARSMSVVLAGGLTASSVGGVVDRVRPFAVDVSSGVESGPGIKDPARVRRFVTAVRSGAA